MAVRGLLSITLVNALYRQNTLKKLSAEEELYRLKVIKWEDITRISNRPNPLSLLSLDSMRGIIA